jgi:hydrophobic/amphiphilic exporter-1 (mainly G- bacteria), HAE1 family
MNIVDLSIKRPVLISMGLIAFVLFGIMAYFSLPLSLLPSLKIPTVTVQTVYAGASPQVIEMQISKKIEDEVSAISEVDSIQSYSMDSVSIVAIDFKYDKDENLALQEVKDKVDAIVSGLPDKIEKPVISKLNMASMAPVMSIILEGDMDPAQLYTFAANTVNDHLAQVSGVGSIGILGGSKREIKVTVDRSTIYERSVSVAQISGLLAAANVEMPGGNFTYENRDIPVQIKGSFTDLDQIKNMDIPTGTGIFKLRQIGKVADTNKATRIKTILFDKKTGTRNENAVLLQIVKNPSAKTVEVVAAIKEKLPVIEQLSSNHVHFKIIKEDATYVQDSVNDTLENIYLGILFTGIVLLLFLHDLRSTLIVALAMPFSIIATFLIMKALGIGLNLLSLMGLSSATGTLVANSVVVLENIFRYRQLGYNRVDAASRGTKEVLVAVFASTLTNIAVFIPLGSISGLMGPVLANFAFTTVIATVFSILVSFTLTPLMASRMLPEKQKKPGFVSQYIESIFKEWETTYAKTLSYALGTRKRVWTLLGVTAGIFAVCLITIPLIGFELFPTTDGGKIQINVELPQGNDLTATGALIKKIETKLAGHKEVEVIETVLGSQGTLNQDVSVGQMNVILVPKDKRKMSSMNLAPVIALELSSISGAKIKVSSVSEITIGSVSTSGLDLYLKGADTEKLQKYAQSVKLKMNSIPGITNTTLSSAEEKQELDFIPDRKQLSEDGLTVQDIAITLRSAIDGLVMSSYRENGKEYDIRVSVSSESLTDISDIRNIPVVSAAGVYPLSRYAKVFFNSSTNKIMRTDKVRTIEVTADILPGYSAGALLTTVLNEIHTIEAPQGYSVSEGGMTKLLGDTVRDLAIVFAIAVLLTYMLLAATLESLIQPLFILSTVPLSLIGAILICLITGAILNIVAMLGIIMLVGIVVNNAILILDAYNQLKKESGLNTTDALIQACSSKLKAILMSNIAIILGMLPMGLGMGASGAEMRQPMGLIIIGGIISSTVMTLYIIPALEFIFSNRKETCNDEK